MKLFADDTSIYIEFDDENNASHTLNEDLKGIQQWADQWLVTFSSPKTKLLTCSFKKKNYSPIKFSNAQLENVDKHKHLGLTLSSNLSWNAHIEALLHSVSPMSDVLKRLKYDLDRYSLERTYFSFIRPKLEYASNIWDNCSKKDCDRLENLQLDIARTVTGARRGTSHEAIYNETNWMTLKERRSLNKFKFFSKIVDGQCPDYLETILPNKIRVNRPHSRHSENFVSIKCRTETFKNSFFPSTTMMWNDLPLESRNSEYAVINLKHKCNPLYCKGCRLNNVKHAQLRMNCSKLNAHLFLLHVSDTSQCACGYVTEDTEHFLLQCPLYHIQRQNMLQSLSQHGNVNDLDVQTLLYGNEEYSLLVNQAIFDAVHQYILLTDRL